MSEAVNSERRTADRELEPELAAFLTAIGSAVNEAAGDSPSVDMLRAAARTARLEWSLGGEQVPTRTIADLDMPTRLYVPPGPPPWPTLMYLHGGGWTMLDLDTHDRLMRSYVRSTGWAVVGLDYPLAPETRFPAGLHACVAAIEHLVGRAEPLGLRGDMLVLGGDSSGANLALACEMIRRRRAAAPLAGLLLNYGVFDCDFERPSYVRFGASPYLLSRERMAFFWDNYCREQAERTDPLASPLHAPPTMLAELPPVRLTIAAQDVLVEENIAMAEHLRLAGVNVSSSLYHQAAHGFLEAVDRSPVADRAVEVTAAWLRAL